jgi:hypothetical protein
MNLTRILKLWQKRLRLEDWDITVKWTTFKELEDDSALGDVVTVPEKRYAQIRILNEEEAKTLEHFDPERTIIHELLHCYFHTFQRRGHGHEMLVEHAVHALSVALVEGYRSNSGLGSSLSTT